MDLSKINRLKPNPANKLRADPVKYVRKKLVEFTNPYQNPKLHRIKGTKTTI